VVGDDGGRIQRGHLVERVASVWATVHDGSASTASPSPQISVDDTGEDTRPLPSGILRSLARGTPSETRTS
jgi:hypothetical protein